MPSWDQRCQRYHHRGATMPQLSLQQGSRKKVPLFSGTMIKIGIYQTGLLVSFFCMESILGNSRSDMSKLVCVHDFEDESARLLDKRSFQYYQSGALAENTLRDNRQAMLRWIIKPRLLRSLPKRNLSTSILGNKVEIPFGVAPAALQSMAHPDGEKATARAAGRMGTVFALSVMSTHSIEDVAASAPETLKFLQIHFYEDRNITLQLMKRAEAAGYKALVLTVDNVGSNVRWHNMRNGFSRLPSYKFANFDDQDDKNNTDTTRKHKKYKVNISFTWQDIPWLKSSTTLPVIVKGILTKEDAELALENRADAIWVSNHGGRELDTAPATLDVLPEIVSAVGEKCEVYVDSGFREGTDIYKALALGARMVFLGRALVWGLTVDGEEGAFKILRLLQKELDDVMVHSGSNNVSEITRAMVSLAYAVHHSVHC